MRELKFRAWDKTTKRMFSVSGMATTWLGRVVTEDYTASDKTLWVIDYELMQYTGLKDKNGKEIYEGDIVKLGDVVGEVLYQPEFVRFIATDGKSAFTGMMLTSNLSRTEIIGNLYEHPALLTGTEEK